MYRYICVCVYREKEYRITIGDIYGAFCHESDTLLNPHRIFMRINLSNIISI